MAQARDLVCLRLCSSLGTLPSSTKDACAACCNESNFGSRRALTGSSGGMADVLVITTTVWVLDRVHCTSSNLRPTVALHPVLVEVSPRLQHGLVQAPTA